MLIDNAFFDVSWNYETGSAFGVIANLSNASEELADSVEGTHSVDIVMEEATPG